MDRWIIRLAWLMDNSIPVGKWSIGLDALLGLVPGFGDAAGSVISMLIIMRAAAAGIPHVALARMFANVAIDAAVGLIPFAGDLFDFGFKANQRNLRIYRASLRGRSNWRHWLFFAALFLALLAVAAIPVALAIWAIRAR